MASYKQCDLRQKFAMHIHKRILILKVVYDLDHCCHLSSLLFLRETSEAFCTSYFSVPQMKEDTGK